jgi:molecular chaperone GrpE
MQQEDEVTEPQQPEEQSQAADMDEKVDEAAAQIEQLKADLEESKSKYLYMFSDFESMRRNAAKERLETIATAGKEIITAMLPILDDFDRAAKVSPLSEGVELIRQKLENTLSQKGLTLMQIAPGDAFNADEMEAVAEIPGGEKGAIVDVLEQGYKLGGKIIRFAKVVVYG